MKQKRSPLKNKTEKVGWYIAVKKKDKNCFELIFKEDVLSAVEWLLKELKNCYYVGKFDRAEVEDKIRTAFEDVIE